MNNREALARAIDDKSVACPYSSLPPFVLTDTWLDSNEAIRGGKPRKLEAICAKTCQECDLHLHTWSGMDLTYVKYAC